jgi:hypothetical protein
MRYRVLSSCLVLVCSTLAHAEKVPLSPEELKKESTHIVTGVVKAKYGRDVDSKLYGPGTIVTQFVLEIEIDAVEKGADLKAKDIVYARCWRLKKHGALGLVPGPSGHRIPEDNAKVRVFLARGKYPATSQDDRGFALLLPNGAETLPATSK